MPYLTDFTNFASGSGSSSGGLFGGLIGKSARLTVGGALAALGIHLADASQLDVGAMVENPSAIQGQDIGRGAMRAGITFAKETKEIVYSTVLPAVKGAIAEAKVSGTQAVATSQPPRTY